MYEARITVASNQPLDKVFAAEDHVLSNNRASYTLSRITKGWQVDAIADDAVAFRAILNAIAKILTIYEKMQKVQ